MATHSIVDMVRNGDIDLILNTPAGGAARSSGYEIRARCGFTAQL